MSKEPECEPDNITCPSCNGTGQVTIGVPFKSLYEIAPGTILYCSFCGKAQHEVKKLIAGPTRVFICDECIELCMDILVEENVLDEPRRHLQS